MEKLMYREVKQLSQCHTAHKWQDWALDPGSLDPRSSIFILRHPHKCQGPPCPVYAPGSQCHCKSKVSLTQCLKWKWTVHHCLVPSDLAFLSMSLQPPRAWRGEKTKPSQINTKSKIMSLGDFCLVFLFSISWTTRSVQGEELFIPANESPDNINVLQLWA